MKFFGLLIVKGVEDYPFDCATGLHSIRSRPGWYSQIPRVTAPLYHFSQNPRVVKRHGKVEGRPLQVQALMIAD